MGISEDERTMAGPLPYDDRDASHHHHLTRRIADCYGAAVQAWTDRVIEYVGEGDEQTVELGRQLDQLARKGVDAERLLRLAAGRKALPIDHASSALAYRVKRLADPRALGRHMRQSIDPLPRTPRQQPGPSLGL